MCHAAARLGDVACQASCSTAACEQLEITSCDGTRMLRIRCTRNKTAALRGRQGRLLRFDECGQRLTLRVRIGDSEQQRCSKSSRPHDFYVLPKPSFMPALAVVALTVLWLHPAHVSQDFHKTPWCLLRDRRMLETSRCTDYTMRPVTPALQRPPQRNRHRTTRAT
jgi:hypothetical protein